MQQQRTYVINQIPLQPQKYTAINLQFIQYSNLFQNWIQTILTKYKLNPPNTILSQSKQAQQLGQQKLYNSLNQFINSTIIINKNHCEYLQEAQDKFYNGKVSYYTNLGSKFAKKIKGKKEERFAYKRQIEGLEGKMGLGEEGLEGLEGYYGCEVWNRKRATIKNIMELVESNLTDPDSNNNQLVTMSSQFEQFLFAYRKKLNKYKIQLMKQSAKVCRSFFQCISQLITLGHNQLTTIVYILKNQHARTSNSFRSSYRSSLRNSTKMDLHVQVINDQNRMLEFYENILNNFIMMYSEHKQISRTKTKNQQQQQQLLKTFFQSNCQIYDQLNRANQIADIFHNMRIRLTEEIHKLIKLLNKKLQENKCKIDILKTIDYQKNQKSRLYLKGKKFSEREPNIQDEGLFGFDVQGMLAQVMEVIANQYDLTSRQCFKLFEVSSYKKSHHHSLMEITSQFKQIIVNQIKPTPEQLWLWKDWRDFTFLASSTPKSKLTLQDLKSRHEKLSSLLSDEKSGSKFQCILYMNKKYKVVVVCQPNSLQILSNKKKIDFIIPKDQLLYIEKLNEKIMVKTGNGAKFLFGSFKDRSPQQFQSQLKEQYKEAGNTQVKKEYIKLTDEQRQKMEGRISNMKKQLPNIDQFTNYTQKQIEADMQTFYEVIFSDSGEFLPSKSDSSFFEYVNVKKFKNYNFTGKNYDQPGPAYYTGDRQSGITFLNCPVYSKRQSQMDHPLPPIPFIPKQCHVVNVAKIFWLSHEELYYLNTTRQTTPELMTNIEVEQLIVVKKVSDDKVKVSILGKINFLKETRMKSILKSGGQGQLKDLCPKMLQQMENSIMVYKRIMARASNPKSNQKQIEIDTQIEGMDSTQKKQDKTILYITIIAILTLLGNIILHYLM